MPTVILLDVSLSMSRPVLMPDCSEDYQRRNLAIYGINSFLDELSSNSKLEFVSLITYSSSSEQIVNFTRDYDAVKTALNKLGDYDKSCINVGLDAASNSLFNEWGNTTLSQVILITDGHPGIGVGSLHQTLDKINSNPNGKFSFPFSFSCKLHIVIIAPHDEIVSSSSIALYKQLINLNSGGGDLYFVENSLTLKNTQAMFNKIYKKHFTPFSGVLKCGHLKCSIQVFPAVEHNERTMNETLEICGFLDIADVASPPCISRHLVLPVPQISPTDKKKDTAKDEKEETEPEENEDGKAAAFTVLLHGSLKVENMIAFTQIGENWFAMIYSWADSKKKSNLMLSIIDPGFDSIPWLGKFNHLEPSEEPAEKSEDQESKSPFPVCPSHRPSYAQNVVVWIKASGLQTDVQKILRHARKLPEKRQNFYKDLNRLRRAALALGFHGLLESLSTMLERECTLLPGAAHPDAHMQLSHVVKSLLTKEALDINHNITPFHTEFHS